MSSPILSIVVCTHNRAELARDAIVSVLEQDFPSGEYELLIVDNASADHTADMAREFCKKYSNVRYIFESNVGLSQARNRGWREARGEYVGYLDDDGKAAPGWLAAARDAAQNIRPVACGGPYYAFYNSPKPAWFKDEYGSHVQGHAPRILLEDEYLDGGNMFIRRDLLIKYGGFDVDLGMKGTQIAYGEETQFFKRLRANEEETVLFYDPNIKIYHLVRAEKMKLWSEPKRLYSAGVYWAKMNGAQNQKLLGLFLGAFKSFAQMFLSIFVGFFVRDRSKYPYFENYLYEAVFFRFIELGAYVEKIRGIPETK